MKKWYDEEYEFEIEVTGFLRGERTERYCRNGEQVGDRYTCTYGCPVNDQGYGICSKTMTMLFPIMEAVRSGGDLENVGGSGPYCKDIVCPDGCVLFRLTAKKPWQVRFIELMPMGVCAAWPPERFLPAQEILSRVPELRPAGRSGVAQLYRLPGAAGTVGLIEPMSCAFCADCTRIRITADGKLKPCLHSDAELALRGLSGAELEAAIRRGILMKPARHRMDETGVTETHRGMFAIGG